MSILIKWKDFLKSIHKTSFFSFLLVLSIATFSAEGQVSLTFSSGYFGTQGSNTNQAKNIKKLATLGISKVSFGQPYNGQFGSDAGTQGNDLNGTIKIYLAAGATSAQAVNSVITLNGALNWRETTGSRVEVFGFILAAAQNASITFNGQTYSIQGGSTSNSSTTLGLKAYSSTFVFTDNEDRSGNAATSGLLDALNSELLTNSPQPSTILLTNNSVTEGQNLVYTVSLSAATSAGNPQVYTFSSSGTSTGGSDFNSTYTFSNGVINNGDGTITVPGGVSSFSITVNTIDDASVESTETLILAVGSKSATGSILDNDAVPIISTSGALKTFSTCSGCTSSPQTFTVSGQYLTSNITVTAPTGVQVSTSINSGYATSINIAPTAGTVTTTTVYAKLTNNATTVSSGVISVTSTGAVAKTITVTTNTDNALMLDGVDDYVNLGDVLDYSTVANTTEAWVYWKGSTDAFSEIFTKDAIQSFSITSGNKLHANFGDGSTWISGLNSTTSVPLNTWTHLAVTRSSTGVVKMYINGVLDASTNTMNVTGNNTAVRSIGAKIINGLIYGPFKGAIENIKVWNVEKSITDITNGMYTDLAGNETDLLAYYDFNQGIAKGTNTSITSLLDKGPSSFNGTITGVALTGSNSNFVDGYIPPIKTFVNANVNNNALSFGGANDYVQTNLDGTALTSFTIEAFINPANTTGTKGILQWAPTNDPTSGIPMVLFQQNNGTGLAVFVNGVYGLNTTLPANSWSHVALVYANSLYTLYVNGTSVATYSGGNQYQSNSAKLYLGTGYPQPWNGLLDEVRIWNTARSASEIFNNMFNDLSGTESGLMAYFNMNQGNANVSNSGTLTDKTSNANNGTFTGFALTGTSSNFIPGNSQIGESAKFSKGTTYQLANALSGGTWSSNNTAVATVNASTGIVTGVASGAASITYSICNKTVSYPVEIYTPTITVNSALKSFVNCSGCGITPQSFTVTGSNLVANLVITAPAGFEVSTASSGTYSSTLSLSSTSVSSSALPIYLRPVNNAVSFSNGSILVTSTGADSRTITLTVNSDNALKFDGVDDIVSTASNIAPLNITGDITVETWIRLNQMPSDYVRLIGKGSPSERSYGLWLYSDGSILWQQFTTSLGVNNLTTSSSVIPVGKWTHIAASKTGSNVKIYINGIEVASTSAHSGTPNSSTASLELGGSSSIHALLNGSMDEVRIWNVGRTANQIAGSYLSELVGNESGLVVNYSFNQGIAGGSNTAISAIEDRTSNGISATLSNFAKTGTTSNFVAGVIPEITAAGNATTVLVGGSLALSNGLAGGVWSSSNSNIASINTSTGLVSGVAAGNATMSYTICGKVVTYNLTVLAPTITTGSLKTFTSCSGCVITPQPFTVAGTNLGANVIITAPTGFEISNASGGTYSSTLTLSPSSGTLTSTNVFARLINSATSATGGNFTVASTGAASKTVTATVNTDNSLSFDGVDDFVVLDNVGSNSNLTFGGTSPFTLEAWVRRTGTTTGNAMIITKQNLAVAGNYVLYVDIDGKPGLFRETATNSSVLATSSLPINEWHHVAGVFDGSNLKIFIDGVLNNTTTGSGSIRVYSTPITSLKVAIGAAYSNNVPSYFFKGNIDEVRVWSVDRSTQIPNNYLTGLAGNETGLVAYYNVDQGTINGSNTANTSLTDRTANAINGTITNFALTGSASNFVPGLIPEISGNTILNKGLTTTYTNSLTGGTWSSSNTNIASVNSSTGVVTGVNPGTSTITYTICEKTVSKVVTVVVPTITTSGTLNAFSTCLGTASTAQTFTVSAQYLTANLVLTAPAGYEIATSLGGTYSSTISIAPTSGVVSARLIYVRLSTASVNGQSGNIAITSTDAATQNVSTGTASVTRSVTAGVTILSDDNNNTICAGSPIVFTATPTNGGNSPTYQWKLNGANITGANSATYSSTSLVNNDAISVLMTSSLSTCINGSPASSNTITTTVTTAPNSPGAISGQSVICMNSNQVYSIAAVPGATSYTWVVTGNLSAAISSTTNVINITAANTQGSGTLTVFANNACGTSVASSSLSITVNNTPAPTASFTLSANTVCLTNGAVSFTNTSTPNATTNSPIGTYSWTFGDGSTAFSANASNTYTTAGTFDPILTITDGNQCTSSFSSRITVDPISVAGTASVTNSTICEGSSTGLILTGYTGAIQWQKSTDGINFTNITGANTAAYNTGNLTTTTYYQAVVTSGACSSATSGVITVTVSPTPAVALASLASINSTATSFDLTYSNAVGSPDEYSITAVGPNAMPNFVAISNYGLPVSPITVSIPASIPGVYNFNLLVKNGSLGCVSSVIPFTQTISASSSTITVTGLTIYTFNGSAQGPATNTKTGSTGAVTYSYSGTGSTTYGPSTTLPTGVGTYQVIATLASDANYSGATSAPYAFVINDAPSVISINRVENTPTNLATLRFVVTFSKDIIGFDVGDLTLVNSGTVSTTSMVVSTITSSTYTVTVGGITGNGTLGLDLKSSGTGIVDSYGAGITNGITGQVYTIDKVTIAPSFITPVTNDSFVGTSLGMSVNIPEANLTNTITLTFVGLSNTVIVTLNNGNGIITGNLNLNNLTASTIVASSSQSTLPSDIYTVTISYQDYLGNPVASTSINNFKVNYNLPSTIVVTGLTTYTYNGSAQGPNTNTSTGSTGAVTYSYSGTGSTTYGPSATLPTGVGTYQVIATLAADTNYSGATSAPYAFNITAASSTITVTGLTTYTYNGSGQGPVTNTKTGSTGAVTYSYSGTGSTTYGPSATLPTGVGTYQVIATLAADANYSGATSAPYAFTITGTANPDTDGDGVTDAQELLDGTNPNDGCSYVVASRTLTPSTAWNALDCDGDGTPNGTDIDPKDPCVYVAGSTPVTTNAIWRAADCDGDGVTNGKETDDGTDPRSGCSFTAASKTLTPTSNWGALDCDGDGNPNATDPNKDTPVASNDAVTVGNSGIATINLLSNDDFLPGANTEIVRQAPPNDGTAKGTVTFNPLTGEMTYKRAPFESGLVTMGYKVTNKAVTPPVSATAFVTIIACDLQDPLADCDGDGDPNGTDTAPNDPCVYSTTLQVKANVSDDWKALDCDGDGVINGTELTDGTSPADGCSFKAPSITLAPSAAWLLLDCDADGITNKVEGTQDFDGDGIPNCLDTDSDGDSISDKLETTVDTDKDGKPDYLDLDSDNDGILDSVENKVCTGTGILCDTDADGTPNFRDLDSDADQISDVIEANGLDYNKDGIADGNIDEKGIPTSANKGLTPPDTDRDGKLDPYDVDSDGDGILDYDEEYNEDADFPDCDHDGIINRLDPDECDIFSPQGISPNGDGKNDRLVFKGLFLRKIPNRLSIYNRWGTLVFEMESYDNSFTGTVLPDGTYYYILDFFGKKPTISNYLSVDRTIK